MTRSGVQLRQGEGPTFVLCHGAGGNEHSFDALLDALAGRRCFIAALPGRCGVPGPPLTTVAQMADYVLEASRGADVGDELVLVGHSLGGAVALEAALRQDARVVGLVLMATGAKLRVHPQILEIMQRAVEDGATAELGTMAWRGATDAGLIEESVAAGRRTPPEAALADWRAANAFDRMARLGQVAVPTLVLAGAEDALTPQKYARFLADGIAGARLELLDDAGHMFPLERAADVAEQLRAFP